MNLNRVLQIFKKVIEAHKKIENIKFGNFLTLLSDVNIYTPLLFIDVDSIGIEDVEVVYNLKLMIADVVKLDKSDQIEVSNDLEIILNDVLNYIKYEYNQELNIENTTFEYFEDSYTEEITGWICDLNVRCDRDLNFCDDVFLDINTDELTCYQKGYNDGYEVGISTVTGGTIGPGFNSGYTVGFISGNTYGQNYIYPIAYMSGYTNGVASVTGSTGAGFDSGYTYGYPIGFNSGLTVGQIIGYNGGFISGNTYGQNYIYPIAYMSGYTNGLTVGFNSGSTYSYPIGYNSGLTVGQIIGFNSGSTYSYPIAYNSGNTYGQNYIYPIAFASGSTYSYPIAYTSGYTNGAASVTGGTSENIGYIQFILENCKNNIEIKQYTGGTMPYAGTITAWSLEEFGGLSGNCQIDVWKDNIANFPPNSADTIFTTSPYISNSTMNSASGLTIPVAIDDVFILNVATNDFARKLNLKLTVLKN
jgi:hypothetical protein